MLECGGRMVLLRDRGVGEIGKEGMQSERMLEDEDMHVEAVRS
jgi:hypothetical protein